MNPLLKRQQATALTVAKYQGRAFKWGSCDCGKVGAFHARKFGWKMPKTGTYKSAIGAAKYLRSLGADTLPDLWDLLGFPRIAPAFAMTGDFVSFQTDDPIGGVGIVVGGGKIMAFHESHAGMVMIDADWSKITRAWSVMALADG